jgi:tRNA(Ile)-lysidine synthase TilS/MesJ
MELQRLLSLTRKAVDDYSQIDEGDKIAVGISGGKDSLTLLYALANLKRFYPNTYELGAITVDLGLPGFDTDPIAKICESLDVPYTVVKTDIYNIIFNDRKESNPCSLCAKMRKGSLNEAIKARGYNKVAYGHHKDDVVETLMMSLIYEGRINTFSPVTYLDRTDITVIRPLLYIDEADIIGFANKYDLPVAGKLCPAD